jgi:preprotein translocase subunit SecF
MPETTYTTDGKTVEKHRNWWIWISAVLAVAVVALLIWGLGQQSDLNDLQQATSTAGASYKQAYADLEGELGTTKADLTQTEQDLQAAKQAQDKAEKDAAAAQKQADDAQDDKAKAEAQAKQAQADADAAEAKNDIAKDCAKAYLTAVGSLLESEDPNAQADKAKQELQDITADCRAALEGT